MPLIKNNAHFSLRLILFLLFLLFSLFLLPVKAEAAVLSLSPEKAEFAINNNFNINLQLDTKNENTTATDVVLTFDPSLLEVIDVSFGDSPLYPTNTKIIDNSGGKLSITASQKDAVSSYNGSGRLAILTFKAKSLGTASVVFSCQSNQTNDSNVFKKGTSTDILECGNLVNGSYTITQTGNTGLVPTNAPTATRTLPQSGNLEPTSLLIVGGTVLLSIGALLIFVL